MKATRRLETAGLAHLVASTFPPPTFTIRQEIAQVLHASIIMAQIRGPGPPLRRLLIVGPLLFSLEQILTHQNPMTKRLTVDLLPVLCLLT